MNKFFGHLGTINKHRFLVFKLSIKAGIPFRGLVHDLSKYSFEEFFENMKYYNSKDKSPIMYCKKANGYSKAWLHHKGHNKHHYEYWYDEETTVKAPIIPYKYTAEMICDTLAAGMTYQGKNWTNDYQLNYFNKRFNKNMVNEKILKVLNEVYEQVKDNGINKVITKRNLKAIYNKYVKN